MENSIYPSSILDVAFRILESVRNLTENVVGTLFKTPMSMVNEWLEGDLPEWLATFLTALLEIQTKGILSNLTLFELLLGSGLVVVLIVGVVKFFGDAFGL